MKTEIDKKLFKKKLAYWVALITVVGCTIITLYLEKPKTEEGNLIYILILLISNFYSHAPGTAGNNFFACLQIIGIKISHFFLGNFF